jgi:large subunit ribosomal protein L25
MEALDLKAELRQITGKHVHQLRRQGYVPAVLYGKNRETDILQIEAKALQKVLSQAGTHQLIALQIGSNKPTMTLARDIQIDVIKRNYMHVDFYAVKMDQKVTAEVPLVFVGVSPAVKELGGTLVHGLTEVEIECLPADLVGSIEVNVDDLASFDDMISVADLKVPAKITILSDPESMVAKVEAPRTVEALEAIEMPTSVEPEVLSAKERSKEEEE